jgi:hypothetical protein
LQIDTLLDSAYPTEPRGYHALDGDTADLTAKTEKVHPRIACRDATAEKSAAVPDTISVGCAITAPDTLSRAEDSSESLER